MNKPQVQFSTSIEHNPTRITIEQSNMGKEPISSRVHNNSAWDSKNVARRQITSLIVNGSITDVHILTYCFPIWVRQCCMVTCSMSTRDLTTPMLPFTACNNIQCPHCINRKHLTPNSTNMIVHVPQKHRWNSTSVGLSLDEEWQQKEQACWACTSQWACRACRYTWDWVTRNCSHEKAMFNSIYLAARPEEVKQMITDALTLIAART